MSICCLDGQAPALGHSVSSVDGKIENGTFEEVAVRKYRPEPAGENGLEVNDFPEGAAKKLRHVRHHFVRLQRLWRKGLLT